MLRLVFVSVAVLTLSACSGNSTSGNEFGDRRECGAVGAEVSPLCINIGGDRKAEGTMVGLWLSKEAHPAFNLALQGRIDEACQIFITEKDGGREFKYALATQIESSGEVRSCDYSANRTLECLSNNPPVFVDLRTGKVRSECDVSLSLRGDSLYYSAQCPGGPRQTGSLMAVSEAGYAKYLKAAYYCSDKSDVR